MGIYSTAAANLLKENEVEYNPNAASLLEFAVNTQKSEQAMFETMLEMDFLEYHVESGNIVLTEENKLESAGNVLKSIGKKIAELFEKLIQTLEAAFNKFANFVLEKSRADKLLIKKFGSPDLAKAKANKPDLSITIISSHDKLTLGSYIAELSKEAKSAAESTGSKEDFDAKKEAVNKKFSENVGTDIFEGMFHKTTIDKVNDGVVNTMIDNVKNGYKGLVENIIGDSKADLKNLRAARAAALKATLPKKGVEADERAVASAKYQYIAALCACLSKSVNFGTRVAAKNMMVSRKAFIAIAMAGNKKAKEEKKEDKKEEAVNASALYDDMFEYALEVATDNMFEEASF